MYILVSVYVYTQLFGCVIGVPSRIELAVVLGYWEFGYQSNIVKFSSIIVVMQLQFGRSR